VLQLQLKNHHDPLKSALYQWRFIYFPINYDNLHWALGKIDTAKKTFIFMDSMRSRERFKGFSEQAKVRPFMVYDFAFGPSLTTEYFHRLFWDIWVFRSSWKPGKS
jgi:hypothetical protein